MNKILILLGIVMVVTNAVQISRLPKYLPEEDLADPLNGTLQPKE